MDKTKTCARCGDKYEGRKRFCIDCVKAAQRAKIKAASFVYRAIQKGKINPPSELECVDCGKQAQQYDHRDYAKPLEIEPVCRSCNLKRGPGKYYLTDHLPRANWTGFPIL